VNLEFKDKISVTIFDVKEITLNLTVYKLIDTFGSRVYIFHKETYLLNLTRYKLLLFAKNYNNILSIPGQNEEKQLFFLSNQKNCVCEVKNKNRLSDIIDMDIAHDHKIHLYFDNNMYCELAINSQIVFEDSKSQIYSR